MAYIRYTTTTFVKPQSIRENEYRQLKHEINKNPNYEIVPEGESFSEHFAGILNIIKICGGIIIGSLFISFVLGIDKDGDVVGIFAGIAFLVLIFSIIPLFLEGPSFAKYKRQKREYFERMKTAIQQTDTYEDFVNSFYIK